MKIETIHINSTELIRDGDFKSPDNFMIVDRKNNVYKNGEKINVPVKLSIDNPKVKLLPNDKFILIDGSKPATVDNAWVINQNLEIERILKLGSVQDIIYFNGNLLCSYSYCDRTILGNTGLTIFNLDGNEIFSYYNGEIRPNNLKWWEIYSFLLDENNKLQYLAYPNFPIIQLSSDFKSNVIAKVPNEEQLKKNEFWNPMAFTRKDENWYFITPDKKNILSRIFKMGKSQRIEQIGTCSISFRPKGLSNGKFFIPVQNPYDIGCKFEIVEI